MTLTQKFIQYISFPILAFLVIFNLRRILFTLTILFAGRSQEGPGNSSANQKVRPDILVLVSCRNEAKIIPDLCQAISRLEYPCEKRQVVLINDGSTDDTGERMEQQAEGQLGWNVLHLPRSIGKASALNSALDRFPFGEILYVLDADHRPDAQAMDCVVRYFQDPQVAGVTGLTKAINSTASPGAYYATVESYINQLVTMRAKDRLRLAPALLGSNCAYRREPLVASGAFRKDAFSEDSDLTVTFHNQGYRTRFAEDVVSTQQVPQSTQGYLKQHVRWGRGLNDVARIHALEVVRNRRLPALLRAELLLFMAGYLDRIALASAGFLALLSSVWGNFYPLPRRLFLFALLTPFAQILALFAKERFSREMWVRLPWIPIFFGLDILAAVRSALDTLFNRSRAWAKTERITG
jgi:cellulose synthase/poly-beta-1,6-N-acetylglucosamine synthase-like glycosyltransferase